MAFLVLFSFFCHFPSSCFNYSCSTVSENPVPSIFDILLFLSEGKHLPTPSNERPTSVMITRMCKSLRTVSTRHLSALAGQFRVTHARQTLLLQNAHFRSDRSIAYTAKGQWLYRMIHLSCRGHFGAFMIFFDFSALGENCFFVCLILILPANGIFRSLLLSYRSIILFGLFFACSSIVVSVVYQHSMCSKAVQRMASTKKIVLACLESAHYLLALSGLSRTMRNHRRLMEENRIPSQM